MYKVFFVMLFMLSVFLSGCIFSYNDYPKDAGGGGNGATYSITGKFIGKNGNAIAGLKVQLTGDSKATALTDSVGGYVFSNLASGSYTVTPGDRGHSSSSVLIGNSNFVVPTNKDGHGGNVNGDYTCSGCHK